MKQTTDNQRQQKKKNNSSSNLGSAAAAVVGAAAGAVGATFIPTDAFAAVTGGKDNDADVVSQDTDHAAAAPHDDNAAPQHNDDNGQDDARVIEHEPRGGHVPHPTPQPEPEPVGPTPNPNPGGDDVTVEVLDYQHVTDEDGNEADVAAVSIGGQTTIIADTTMDGYANVAISDANANGQIEDNEIVDISDQHIAMQPFHDAAPNVAGTDVDPATGADPDNTLAGNSPDYTNDGNVDDFMA